MRTFSWNAHKDLSTPCRGFTLVELLIVISIIGVLVALIMPATNSARESGRRAQCAANLHQMALGCLQCESANGYYPSGGWGWQWAGEGDRGYGMMQPAGWHYNILPYIDQADLRNMDKGLIKIGDTSSSNSARRQAGMQQAQVPVAIFLCPTRHPRLKAFPRQVRNDYVNINEPAPIIGRSDYAANGGSNYTNVPGADDNGVTVNGVNYSPYAANFPWYAVGETVSSRNVPGVQTGSPCTGVICVASQVTKAMIKDGDSNTYLIGERYLNPDCYNTYTCCDNDQGWDQGFDWDTIRGTGYGYVYTNSNTGQPDGSLPPNTAGNTIPPAQDHPGYSTNGSCSWNFGSAHPAGFHMAFCDGSVKKIPFEINPTVHMQLGHRSDGQPTDGSWAENAK